LRKSLFPQDRTNAITLTDIRFFRQNGENTIQNVTLNGDHAMEVADIGRVENQSNAELNLKYVYSVYVNEHLVIYHMISGVFREESAVLEQIDILRIIYHRIMWAALYIVPLTTGPYFVSLPCRVNLFSQNEVLRPSRFRLIYLILNIQLVRHQPSLANIPSSVDFE
jgi:hypothetical protein